MKKLIIWDFDGVIADTEHIATDKYVEFAEEYGISLTRDNVIQYIIGKGQQKQLEAYTVTMGLDRRRKCYRKFFERN